MIRSPSDSDTPLRVLLVDDEKEYVLTLSERLQARNFDTRVVHEGADAQVILQGDDPPDVVVLDLQMPGMHGLEVLRWAKREGVEAQVIILTGHGSDKERARAGELGAFAYLQKPIDITVLTDTMMQAQAKVEAERKKEG